MRTIGGTIMPATLQEFIKDFTGGSTGGTGGGGQASQYLDRFASNRPEDQEFDNRTMHEGAAEYLGQMPEGDFHQATQNAFSQAQPEQRQGLLSHLVGALTGRGVNLGPLVGRLGMTSANPQQMGAADYARLANFARTNHPEIMQEHVQSQPWLLKAMGNPVVKGALG